MLPLVLAMCIKINIFFVALVLIVLYTIKTQLSIQEVKLFKVLPHSFLYYQPSLILIDLKSDL